MASKGKKTRVGILTASFRLAGVELVAVELSRGLSDLGYEVEILAYKDEGALRPSVDQRVSVFSYPWDEHRRSWTNSVSAIERYLRERTPDALIANYMGVAQVAHKRADSRTKLIVVNHGILNAKTLGNLIRRFSFHNLQEYMTNCRADSAVGVSKGLTDHCMSEYPAEIRRTVYNPIITPQRRPLADAPIDHRWLKGHGQNERPTIVTVGRLFVRQKAQDMLLRAFKKTVQEMDAQLVIVGYGDDLPMLQDLADRLGISGQVDFAGGQSNPFPYMKAADLFVLPSIYEGLPTVLIEALFCGTPIVSTDCPHGPREILEDGRYGELVPVGDEDALAAAVVRALKSPPSDERRAELRARAEQFDDKTAARRYAELIEELIKNDDRNERR